MVGAIYPLLLLFGFLGFLGGWLFFCRDFYGRVMLGLGFGCFGSGICDRVQGINVAAHDLLNEWKTRSIYTIKMDRTKECT